MSREEELLTALINGEDVSGWKCRSRMEEYLLKCCCGDTCDGMTPKTRVEVLLKQLATKIAEGGSGGVLVITKKGTYDVRHYDFVIVDPQEEQEDVLTEEQIQALESILISHEDINNVSITYNDEILDFEIRYENEELIIYNNMKQVSFRINENKELEVTY